MDEDNLFTYLPNQELSRAIPSNPLDTHRISNFITNKLHSRWPDSPCPKKPHLLKLPLFFILLLWDFPDRGSASILVTSYFGLSPTKLVPLIRLPHCSSL